MGCGVLMGGWIGGGQVSDGSRWVHGMRLGLCFLLLFLFFCGGGGFGVLLCYLWCDMVMGGMWVGR